MPVLEFFSFVCSKSGIKHTQSKDKPHSQDVWLTQAVPTSVF